MKKAAIKAVEEDGIVFIDEIDKIVSTPEQVSSTPTPQTTTMPNEQQHKHKNQPMSRVAATPTLARKVFNAIFCR